MKSQSKTRCVPPLLLASLALCFASGCGQPEKESPATADKASMATTSAKSTSAVEDDAARPKSAIKNSYDEIANHLDMGGSAYFYLSTERWLTGLSERVSSLREFATKIPNLNDADRALANQAFDIASRLVKNCGVEQISGVGMSSVNIGEKLYRNKFMLHHYPGNNDGYLWSVAGDKPHAFPGLDHLPASTAYASFSDFKVGQLWEIIRSEMQRSGVPEAQKFLDEFPAALQQQTGLSLAQITQSLGNEFGFVITLDPDKKMALPLPTPAPLEIPAPGLMVMIKVNNAVLFDKIDQTLTQAGLEVGKADEDGLKMRTVKAPPSIPFTPAVALSGDYLFLSSSIELVREAMAVKQGEQPGLKTTPEFLKLAQGVKLEGNHFSFASERFTATIMEAQRAMIPQNSEAGVAMKALMTRMQSRTGHSLGVFANTEEGWLLDSKGSQSGGEAVVLAGVVAPTAVAAGLLLPALSQAKGRAQEIKCINNAKQVGLAIRIYRNENNDTHPPRRPGATRSRT